MVSAHSTWVKRRFLGRGTYGSVFLASPAVLPSKPSTNPPLVAVKSACIDNSWSLQLERDVLYELRGCGEIVQCFGEDVSVEHGVEVYNLLLEYAPGGTLEDVILKGGRMMESQVSCYVSMILKALSHVHEEGYVHCDLKPSNILVFPRENFNFLKLADFGLAKKSGQMTKMLGLHKNRGTLLYSSPESVAFGEHEAAMDIWSVGCIMVEMLFRKPLWNNVRSTVKDVELMIANFKDEFLRFLPRCLSEITKDFLRRCLTRNVKDRWTADQLLRHPFITENVVSVPESCSRLMAYPKSPFEGLAWVSEQCLFS